MNTFYKLKAKLGRFAVHNLSFYVTVIFGIGFLLLMTQKGQEIYYNFLAFLPYQVLHGQIWRILTAIFFPPAAGSSLLMGVLSIFIYYNFASTVERSLGDFEYNLYFFGSIMIGELGNILYYLVTKVNAPFLPVYTHFSVFMAFAILYSEARVLLFFIIPVKVKWLALAELLLYVVNFITGDLYTKFSIGAALVPVILFYFLVHNEKGDGNVISNLKFQMEQKKRQKEWRDQWKQ